MFVHVCEIDHTSHMMVCVFDAHDKLIRTGPYILGICSYFVCALCFKYSMSKGFCKQKNKLKAFFYVAIFNYLSQFIMKSAPKKFRTNFKTLAHLLNFLCVFSHIHVLYQPPPNHPLARALAHCLPAAASTSSHKSTSFRR